MLVNSFSKFGKSENAILNKFISENNLRWFPYNKFKDVEYLDKGGFGTINKAIWLDEHGDRKVVLKCYNNLNENLDEFLNEWNYHKRCLDSLAIINLYGFTKDPNTSNYMVVMDFANKGNLRKNLTKVIEKNWKQKLFMLYKIISGLNEIHEQNLIHCDFHDGNILNHEDKNEEVYISDLGLCQPAKTLKKYDVCGVIPFIAPEVLRGKPYTLASDIYSFSMIMWEFTSGVPPFNDRAHDFELSLDICKGERPKVIEKIPQCYINLMKRCWSEDPLKRPSALEIKNIIRNWLNIDHNDNEINEELRSNIMEFIKAPLIGCNNNFTAESHPQAYYTSRLLDFTSKRLNETLESLCLDCIIDDIKSLDIKTDEN
ncbi:hypothetical protein RclHR1_00010013 [Rhizophagus clarus]|uniref:Protein kinase domain-containing protein n=1 Tax=Rhizophagus clarus TaxID=94130 RepID=A0A2Z6QEE2_9GLOM|nr:hypothetical protein RclHR1_00010013 [Rhizophagus clarus]